ncbi:MAG: dephosphocoenzyme a kinase, dephospho-CoA kinase [Candidatus Peregrinibacteria bacterium GW2011_GWF2_38_29]|nr:MAG: dephosphocoenzyme a kinase, dephospho-CoA kinase [Candidatus Peregrinibacteria bacterium GW2011_GWF2_38_29]HBB02994.1 dephospho-CoA kinase [Candidatus Peregrinibacteria bacterium]
MKHLIIGVSGKIGSGKTTFCNMCEKFGAMHINSDKIVHKMYESRGKGAKLVKDIFGEAYLDENGTVLRTRLRKHFIENNADFKRFLDEFYPILVKEIVGRIKTSGSRVIFLEFIDFDIKIFKKLIDVLVHIECDEKFIFKRYGKKFPIDYLKQVLAIQKFSKSPNIVIKNNSTKADLRSRARDFIMSI